MIGLKDFIEILTFIITKKTLVVDLRTAFQSHPFSPRGREARESACAEYTATVLPWAFEMGVKMWELGPLALELRESLL